MIQLIIGITSGIVLDGVVTITAIKLLKNSNERMVNKAVKDFEAVIEQKTIDIIKVALVGKETKGIK